MGGGGGGGVEAAGSASPTLLTGLLNMLISDSDLDAKPDRIFGFLKKYDGVVGSMFSYKSTIHASERNSDG